VRLAYRLLFKGATLALLVAMFWSYLGSTGQGTTLFRLATTVAVLILVPFLLYRWLDPPTTPYMFCIRRGLGSAEDRPRTFAYKPVSLSQVAKPMRVAVVIAEDLVFYRHIGFVPSQIVKAYRFNKYEREPGGNRQGGSSISQQLVKNLFLLPTQTWTRKAVEAVLTLILEGLWPKHRILEVYLNVVEFGHGIFGVEAASHHFFGHSAATLSAKEAALLAAVLPGPHIYRAEDPSPTLVRLQRRILQRMGWCADWVEDPP
jgi:monofunctional biosynthetic peptidoglycan transglycosylase